MLEEMFEHVGVLEHIRLIIPAKKLIEVRFARGSRLPPYPVSRGASGVSELRRAQCDPLGETRLKIIGRSRQHGRLAAFPLLHGHRFRQVAGLVGVFAHDERSMVGEHLDGGRVDDRREIGAHVGHL